VLFSPPVELANVTDTGFFSVVPVVEESMATCVADAVEALEEYDVGYETTARGTIIETEDSS
jgi:uncharacterized protein YqgV (UPF0045/DUF77 family)